MGELRIATRRSKLALAQAQRVAVLLSDRLPEVTVRLVPVDASGDADPHAPVSELTEMGAFVRRLQAAVLDGAADAAVHSLKDLPTATVPELVAVAYPERDSPYDVLVGSRLADLPPGALVGTGSPRRRAQLLCARPDLRFVELRGNVDTRLAKVADGQVAAAVLAEAGLRRLGRAEAVAERLTDMVPAPGQGALVVEAAADSAAAGMLAVLDDPALRTLLEAERALLAETGAGCRSSLGALATWQGTQVRLEVFVSDQAGPRRTAVVAESAEEAVAMARQELSL